MSSAIWPHFVNIREVQEKYDVDPLHKLRVTSPISRFCFENMSGFRDYKYI